MKTNRSIQIKNEIHQYSPPFTSKGCVHRTGNESNVKGTAYLSWLGQKKTDITLPLIIEFLDGFAAGLMFRSLVKRWDTDVFSETSIETFHTPSPPCFDLIQAILLLYGLFSQLKKHAALCLFLPALLVPSYIRQSLEETYFSFLYSFVSSSVHAYANIHLIKNPPVSIDQASKLADRIQIRFYEIRIRDRMEVQDS